MRDIAKEICRSRRWEKTVLEIESFRGIGSRALEKFTAGKAYAGERARERELSGDIAAGAHRSRRRESHVLKAFKKAAKANAGETEREREREL